MSRRPPSLCRVAIEDDCPGFTGTTRTLRLPLPHPAQASFPSPGPYHGRLIDSFPRGRRCQRRGAWTFAGGGRPFTAVVCRGGQRISQVPAQTPLPPCSCSFDPGEDRTELALSLRPTRPRGGERPWLSRCTFEAQSHGLTTCCLRFKAPGRPGTMQDSLPTARLRSVGWVSHPQGLL
jgi:hypothetical protein